MEVQVRSIVLLQQVVAVVHQLTQFKMVAQVDQVEVVVLTRVLQAGAEVKAALVTLPQQVLHKDHAAATAIHHMDHTGQVVVVVQVK
jgi:hypothetical protein